MPATTPDLHFRVATAADLPLVHPLIESAYRGEGSRLGWTTETDLLAGTRIDEASLLAKITNPAGAVLLAFTPTTSPSPPTQEPEQQTPTLLACCEITQPPPPTTTTTTSATSNFSLFAVSPRHQNTHIGRRMLAHAEGYAARAWGATRLELTTIASRTELVAWYVRRGFVATGEERPFPEEELRRSGGRALVGGLRFVVLVKGLDRLGGEGVEGGRDGDGGGMVGV
ncbi:hypothetical protein CHGG_09468 [Chaetomium globosum CBS 148.51]|uniref:N-acetyltransferase domain-containing protein n=1 Tax=Chaetomium globosum (strain ATCC 6205 / CBS 148.51 / DSM 1962 / NBRC 6347 / NRRL 1970) TaxID=306901 RepID=Q2GRD6_CHAGB|nr:uncharacterized protein CHGG_09468 [Chaetomium globosum CBS 148.51]EAQ85454.1 hypothetical protein CHGG_09468 [Chaetomium globosum CBS 148.51]